MSTFWHADWAAVRQRVEANPEVQRLHARLQKLGDEHGNRANARAQRTYLDRYRVVQEQARIDQTEVEGAGKRSVRQGRRTQKRTSERA